jgi:uncharacterized DUF497 family protein
VRFEWDIDKAASNVQKHGVSFEEASTIFVDPLARTELDEEHSQNEERFATIGISSSARMLVAWHTERLADDGELVVRLIGARRPTPTERRFYESEE